MKSKPTDCGPWVFLLVCATGSAHTMEYMGYDLGIIGAGNMAEAIARGVLARGVLKPSQIIAADPSPQRRQIFESLKIITTDQNMPVGRESRAILLSVKPQQMA